MKLNILLLFLFSLTACKDENTSTQQVLESGKSLEIENSKLKVSKVRKAQNSFVGIWTDGNTQNATFEIKPKSIYYVEHFEDYSYKLENDIIEIKYPDYTYIAKIALRNDTLIMKSEEYGEAKFWRFKQ